MRLIQHYSFSIHLFPFYFFFPPISFFGPYIFPVSNLWIPQHFSRRYSHWMILLLRRVTIWTPMWQGLERTKTTTASESEASSLCLTPTAWGTTHSSLWCRIYSKLFFFLFFQSFNPDLPLRSTRSASRPPCRCASSGSGQLELQASLFLYLPYQSAACMSFFRCFVLFIWARAVGVLASFRPRFDCLFFLTHHGFRAAPGLIWYLLDCFNSRRSHVDSPWALRALTEPFLTSDIRVRVFLQWLHQTLVPVSPLFLILRTPQGNFLWLMKLWCCKDSFSPTSGPLFPHISRLQHPFDRMADYQRVPAL